MRKRRMLCGVLAAVVSLAALLGGCGKEKQVESKSGSDFLEYLKTAEYPIETDETLSWWSYRGGTTYGTYASPDQLPYLKYYEEKTGIHVDWTFASSSNVKQQFNLLVASGDFPDIIGYYWGVSTDFPGGPTRAIQEEFIADLNELIPTYAPNFNAYLESNPIAQKELKTDESQYYYLPSYVTSLEANGEATNGYVFRKDWLDDLGLSVPETIDEWYTVLKAFKEKKGAEAPFTIQYANMSRGLTGPYEIKLGMYRKGNTVKYGYAEEGYREFLTEMSKWYQEGLLDSSFATIDSKTVTANLLNGKSGAAHLWSSTIKTILPAGREKDADFTIVGAPFPVKNKGDKPQYGTRDPMVYVAGSAIGYKSNKKELAMKLLDYGFTAEGRELMSYGIEGETFEIVDGQYQYTDLIKNNPDGLTMSEAQSVYIRNSSNIPVLKGDEGLRAVYVPVETYPEYTEARAIWAQNDPTEVSLPQSLAPRYELSNEYAKLQTEINTYASEMFLKFIIGEEPLENFDQYIGELKKRGLDRFLSITQETYDRYLKR